MSIQTERPSEAFKFRNPIKNTFSISESNGRYAISLVGFSGRPFHHWWWGNCVFDRSGAIVAPDAEFDDSEPTPESDAEARPGKIPIDFDHDSKEGLGFLERYEGKKEFRCFGYLLPFKPHDRANEIITKKEQGMPYQCSVHIAETNLVTEYISEGETAIVNDETVVGPITIFRKFEVLGVAICLYATDTNTALFNNQRQGVHFMPKETPAGNVSAREEAKKFAKKFGNDRGFKYFSEGLTEEQASDAYIGEVAVELDEKDQRIAELESKNSELVAKIAELEAVIAEIKAAESTESNAASEETPVTAEEFAKLKQRMDQFSQAAGHAGGEQQPLSGGGPAPEKREFSPLKPGLRAFAARAKTEAANAKRATSKQ